MRKPSGILHVADFKTEEIISAIQPKDYWGDKRHWEIKNNIDTFDFTVFDGTEQSATLMQQNLVLKEVRDGRILPYVITEVEQNSDDRSVTVYASGEWILLAKSGIIKPQRIEGKTVNEFIDMALAGTKWKRGRTEYAGFHTMTIDEFIDPLKFLKDIASLFELEIIYRAEVVGSKIVGRYVDMVKKRGREATGKEVTLGKDLVGIKRIENSQNICTALVGFVKGEEDKIITIESINNGLPYIVDNDAFQRWNERGQHKFGFYSPETDDQNMTPQRLLTLMKTELGKRVNTSTSYEVEAQSIGRVFGLAHELINEGDVIRIKDTGFTPKLYLEARAIAGDESFTDPTQDKYVFGDYREITDPNEELRKLYNKILATLGNKANKELLEQLEELVQDTNEIANAAQKESQAAKDIAEKVQDNLKNYQTTIIESENPPTTGLEDGKTLWLDISNGKPGILKMWKNGDWEPVVPDVEGIKNDVLEEVEEINKELNERINETNKKAEELRKEYEENKDEQGKINQITKGLEETVEGQKQTITQIKGDQEKLEKNVVEIEQSVGGIKNTVSGIEESQTGIIDRVTKTEQTVSGITTTVEELETNAEQTTQKINKVEQDANGMKTTIEKIEKNAYARNFVPNGDFKDDRARWSGITNPTAVKIVDVSIPGVKDLNKALWTNSPKLASTQELNVQDFMNEKGIISGYVNVKKLTSEKDYPRIYARMAYMVDGKETYRYALAKQTEVTDGFVRISIPFDTTHPNGHALTGFRANFSTADTIECEVEFTGISITKTDKLVNWSPALENGVSGVDFNKVTTEIIQEAGHTKEKLEQVSGKVDEKVNITEFEKKTTEIDKSVEGIKTDVKKISDTQGTQATQIKQLADEVSVKVDINKVEDYVGGLGTINELRNTRFLQDKNYWATANASDVVFTIDKNETYLGDPSAKLTVSGNAANTWRNITSSRTPVTPGENVVCSAYLKVKNWAEHEGQKMRMMIIFWDKNGTQLTAGVNDFTFPANTWHREQLTKVVPENAVEMALRMYVARNGTFWAAHPMLQRGKKATEYWENPKDYTEYDKLTEDIAHRVATEDYNKKVTELSRDIKANADGISLKASKSEVYTKTEADGKYAGQAYVKDMEARININEQEISQTVKNGNIISAINQTAEKITINVAKLDINADTVVKWLTASGIDTNVINVRGDKITIDKNGVTVKMLDFLFQDEWGTKTTAVSRRNLIADPDFSSVTKKNIGNANYYGFEGGYGLSWKSWGNVVIEKNTSFFDYEQMVNAARVDAFNYPEAVVNNGIHPGNEYTVSAHFRTAMINGIRKTGKPRLHVCCVKFRDNVSYDIWNEQKMDFPEPSAFYGEIRRYSFTFTVPKNYIPQEHALIIKVYSGNADIGKGTAVCVSGVTLYSGKYASMYNWDRAAAERADGLQPFNSLAVGGVNNNIGPSPDGKTFDISTENEVKFFNYIRATQGINLGGNANQQWGHIRFTDGNRGIGFYVSNSNGWQFNALG